MIPPKKKSPVPKKGRKTSSFSFLHELRRRKIIEALAAFIGGGWLILEFVHWILIDHYHFPEESLDITFITLLSALLCTLIWQWFRGIKKRPRKIKVEFFLIPLVILTTAFFDIHFIRQMEKDEGETIQVGTWNNSIAVLPFQDFSLEKNQEHFCDGMTEYLITQLSRVEELKVISRTSVMRYKDTKKDIKQIGEELNVATILEGSIQKEKDDIRVSAQLINVADDFHLWSETYDRRLESIFAIQDEISQAIVNALRIEIVGKEKTSLVKRYTEDFEAYNLYSMGRWFWSKRTEEGLIKAIEYFEQAIEVDPNYALAYAGLADSYNLLGDSSYLPPRKAYPKAKEAALKALKIDNTLAEAHTSLAFFKKNYEWDWKGAEKEYKRAIELNPGYATAHHWYAFYLLFMDRFDEAIREMKRALELDPLSLNPISFIINCDLGQLFYYARQHDQAMDAFRNTLEMYPNFWKAHYSLGRIYVQKGMYEEAIKEYQKAIELLYHPGPLAHLGYAYGMSDRREQALKMLDELHKQSKRTYVSAYYRALIYVSLGEKDKVFEWLKKAYTERDSTLHFLKVEFAFDNVRSDPRFTALLKKVGLE